MKKPLLRLSARVRRRVVIFAAAGLFLAMMAAVFGVHQLGETLLVPERRVPGDWQSAVINEPAWHGVTIERFSTFGEDGISIHALLVRPSERPGTSVRYSEMRRRLGREFAVPAVAGDRQSHARLRGTVFLLHGRSGIKEDGVTIAERFAAAGLATVLFDSRAHGESPARTMSYGAREVSDLRVLIDAVEARYGDAGNAGAVPLLGFGNSMGAAVTLQALPEEARLRAAVVVSPFASLSELTGEMLKRRLPAGAGIVRRAVAGYARGRSGLDVDAISPERAAASISVPVMVVHGDCDGVIPVTHARRVFEAIDDDRKIWRCVAGGQHGNLLMTGGDDLYEEIVRFFLQSAAAECDSANLAVRRVLR